MKTHKILPAVLFLILSCQQRQTFDRKEWMEVGDLNEFPNRKYMVNDLVEHYQLKGKSFSEIIDLLGDPQSDPDSSYQLKYDVDISYGNDIDPIYTKSLYLQFDRDSIVESFQLREWRKQTP